MYYKIPKFLEKFKCCPHISMVHSEPFYLFILFIFIACKASLKALLFLQNNNIETLYDTPCRPADLQTCYELDWIHYVSSSCGVRRDNVELQSNEKCKKSKSTPAKIWKYCPTKFWKEVLKPCYGFWMKKWRKIRRFNQIYPIYNIFKMVKKKVRQNYTTSPEDLSEIF